MDDFLRFYGTSDDLVEIEGWVRDEIGTIDRPVRVELGSPATGGLAVMISYGITGLGGARAFGVWLIAFAPLDEDVLCPWRVDFDPIGNERGYSFGLIVHCPKGTPLRAWRGDEEYALR